MPYVHNKTLLPIASMFSTPEKATHKKSWYVLLLPSVSNVSDVLFFAAKIPQNKTCRMANPNLPKQAQKPLLPANIPLPHQPEQPVAQAKIRGRKLPAFPHQKPKQLFVRPPNVPPLFQLFDVH